MTQVNLVFDYTNSAFKALGSINDDGPGYEPTLVEKRPNDSESIYLDAKSTESGVEDIKTLSSNEITTLD